MKNCSVLFIVMPAIGSLVGGVCWIIVYSLNHSGIEFDGPAGSILLMSIIAGWLAFSILGLIYSKRIGLKQNLLVTIATILMTGMISGFAIGYAVSAYSINHFSNGPSEY